MPLPLSQARSSNISYAGLAMQAGINKDAARVGLSEIFQKFGHYAGTLGDAARLQFAGVGTLVSSQRNAHFNANVSCCCSGAGGECTAALYFSGAVTHACSSTRHTHAQARSLGTSMSHSSPALRAPLTIPSNAFASNTRAPPMQSVSDVTALCAVWLQDDTGGGAH